MASISERKNKDGSISYRVEIRIKRKGTVVYREIETWSKRKHAEHWAAKRETELREPGALERAIAGHSKKDITVS